MSINDELKNELLKNISLSGAASEENASEIQIVLGSRTNLNHILNLSSGMPRIRGNVISKFKLLLSQPLTLQALNPFQIRCCLCQSVISYPAWYYSIRYSVNHFHYFICFDSNSTNKPTARCYRRI